MNNFKEAEEFIKNKLSECYQVIYDNEPDFFIYFIKDIQLLREKKLIRITDKNKENSTLHFFQNIKHGVFYISDDIYSILESKFNMVHIDICILMKKIIDETEHLKKNIYPNWIISFLTMVKYGKRNKVFCAKNTYTYNCFGHSFVCVNTLGLKQEESISNLYHYIRLISCCLRKIFNLKN